MPSPEKIQPETKIKLVLKEPNCPRIGKIINEAYKYKANNSETCRICPVFDLCAKFVKYHNLFENEKDKIS